MWRLPAAGRDVTKRPGGGDRHRAARAGNRDAIGPAAPPRHGRYGIYAIGEAIIRTRASCGDRTTAWRPQARAWCGEVGVQPGGGYRDSITGGHIPTVRGTDAAPKGSPARHRRPGMAKERTPQDDPGASDTDAPSARRKPDDRRWTRLRLAPTPTGYGDRGRPMASSTTPTARAEASSTVS